MTKTKQAENNCSEYPQWVCGVCATDNGGKWSEGHVAAFHGGICGWCNQTRAVTQPRDYGYPAYKG